MKVNFDFVRLTHLVLLIAASYVGGQALMHYLEDWSPLAAYGLACSIVCQVSSAVMKINEFSTTEGTGSETKEGEKSHGNPKKKKKIKAQKDE